MGAMKSGIRKRSRAATSGATVPSADVVTRTPQVRRVGNPAGAFATLDEDGESLEDEAIGHCGSGTEADPLTQVLQVAATAVVGIRYYSGIVNAAEQVLLVREPLNPFDSNAIKVVNTLDEQVGHIPRADAAVLAPFLDNGMIEIEAETTAASSPKRYRLPLRACIYCRESDAEYLSNNLLPRITPAAPFRARTQDLHFDPELQGAESTTDDSDSNLEKLISAVQSVTRRTSQKLMDDLAGGIEKLEKMPEVEQPPDMTVQLLPYQRQGLRWLIESEHPQLPATQGEVVQFYTRVKHKVEGKQELCYINLATKHTTTEPPTLCRGGLLADEMGLGKTLQMLALVWYDRFPIPCVEKPLPMSTDYISATLVVCPLGVISNWERQARDHIAGGQLRVLIFHGPDRYRVAKDFANYDIVLTTYNTVAVGYRTREDEDPVARTKWRRVILDEAHLIRNKNALQSKACRALRAERKWCISGTPLMNNVSELFAPFAFLGYHPFGDEEHFTRLVSRPIRTRSKQGMERLQVLMRSAALRRTKTMKLNGHAVVELPPCEFFNHYVDLDPEDRTAYTRLEQEARNTALSVASHDRAVTQEQPAAALGLQARMLEVLCRLRQTCNHTSLIKKRKWKPGAKPTSIDYDDENVQRLLGILMSSDTDDCAICLCPPERPVITFCAHVFCEDCIQRCVGSGGPCPLCRANVSPLELLTNASATEDADGPGSDGTRPFVTSAKMRGVIDLLLASMQRDLTAKTIMFSQWTSLIDLFEIALKEAGIAYRRYDGTMRHTKRQAVLDEFQQDPAIPVILMSLQCASLGLNVTKANQVFLIDPWWNPSVEEQAVQRVHRIGQLRPVKVYRVVVRDTVEERVLDLQEKKRKMAQEVLLDKRQAAASTRIDDIRFLLNMDANTDNSDPP